MVDQHLAPTSTSKGPSARKSKAIDLDSIMMGIEEYLNDNESDQEQKSHDDNDETDRNKDDEVGNYNDNEATASPRDVPASILDDVQSKEDGNIDSRHSGYEGEENNVNPLGGDDMQLLEHDLVGKGNRVDGGTQAFIEDPVSREHESKPFKTADVQNVQKDMLWGREKSIEGSEHIEHVEKYEHEFEVTSDLEGNDIRDEGTSSQVRPPVDQSKDVKEESQREEVPTKAKQLADIAKQTEIIARQKEAPIESGSRQHELTKNLEESNDRKEVAGAVAEQDIGEIKEPEQIRVKGKGTQNIAESVENINEAINDTGEKDQKSTKNFESAGDMARQFVKVKGVATEAEQMKGEMAVKCVKKVNRSEKCLTKASPVGNTLDQSGRDEHEKAFLTEDLIEHERDGNSGNKETGNVFETVKDADETEDAPPRIEHIEQASEEGRREETSMKSAPIVRKSEDVNGNKVPENALDTTKDTEGGKQAPTPDGLIEGGCEKEGGETSLEPTSIERESEDDNGNEIAKDVSQAVKDTDETGNALPQSEHTEEADEDNGRRETSMKSAPVVRESEDDNGNKVPENALDTTKDTEGGKQAPTPDGLIEGGCEKEGGETSLEPTSVGRESEDDNGIEIAKEASQAIKDTDETGNTLPQSEHTEEADEDNGRRETSRKSAPVVRESEDDNGNKVPENALDTTKDTEGGKQAPPQSELIEKEGGHGEIFVATGSVECEPNTKLGEYVAEANKGEILVDQTGPIESQNDDAKKEGEQFGEGLFDHSKNFETKNKHDETTGEAVSDQHDPCLAKNDEEGASFEAKVVGNTSGSSEAVEKEKNSEDLATKIELSGDIVEPTDAGKSSAELETNGEACEVTKKGDERNELQELAPEADSSKDMKEPEAVKVEQGRPEETWKEDKVNESLATTIEIKTAEEQTELAQEKAEGETATEPGAVEDAVESAKNTQESVTKVDSIGETAGSLGSVEDGAEEGDAQDVHPVSDPSQNVDYSLEPIGVTSADIASVSTDSPNKIQADLPMNPNSGRSSPILPLVDTAEDTEAAYSGTSKDQLDQVSTKAEQDTNRQVTTMRFPESSVADNSGLTEEIKKENSAHNDPMREDPETQIDDHKSAQADGEEVEKYIEDTENVQNISSTDSRKPEQPTPSTSFDAETEAILKGLENPQELLKELELERRSEPVYIFTSLAGGGFHIIPRTNRLATILQANRIEFTYRDLGTDPQARNLWKAHAKGKQLPGLVRGSDVVGNWQDIDEANEEYRIDELLYGT